MTFSVKRLKIMPLLFQLTYNIMNFWPFNSDDTNENFVIKGFFLDYID